MWYNLQGDGGIQQSVPLFGSMVVKPSKRVDRKTKRQTPMVRERDRGEKINKCGI